jgi:hypothetical protein
VQPGKSDTIAAEEYKHCEIHERTRLQLREIQK